MTPHLFFYISDITNTSTLSGESLGKKINVGKFRANVLNGGKLSAWFLHVCASGGEGEGRVRSGGNT